MPWFLVVAGVIVHFTVRDAHRLTAPIYYALPLPVLIMFCAGIAVGGAWRKSRPVLAVALAALMLLCAIWVHESWRPGLPAQRATTPALPSPSSIAVCFWNAGRGMLGLSAVIDHVAASGADVIGIVEAGAKRADARRRWTDRLAGYEVRFLDGGMLLAARGKIGTVTHRRIAGRGHCNRADIGLDGTTLTVMLVDIRGNPFVSRAPAFVSLDEMLQNECAAPTVVMGDFNTPLGSAFFDAWRSRFVHAFSHAGRGPSETWLSLLPLLTIDHAWVTRDIVVEACRLETSRSDHRALNVTLRVSRPPGADNAPDVIPGR